MPNLSDDQIAQLTFDNTLVTEMSVDAVGRSLTIHCDRAFLDEGEDAKEIHGVSLSVIGFDRVTARIYSDENFEVVDAGLPEHHLAELCEFTKEDGKLMISGFSTQEGSWSDFSIEGGEFAVAYK